MKRCILAVVLSTSCVHYGADKPFSPTMAPYVDSFQSSKFGVTPTDLSGSVGDPNAPAPTAAEASNATTGLKLDQLEYAGLTPKGICFLYRDMLAPDNEDPVATVAKGYTDELVNNPAGGMWIEAVESLKALSPVVPWPAPATSVRVTSVDVLSDEKVTLTEKKHLDNGDYVEVKHDYRIVSLSLCSAKPTTTPTTKFLVAGRHIAPGPNDLKFDDDVSGAHEDYNEEVRRQHNVFFVWELSDNGKFELNP